MSASATSAAARTIGNEKTTCEALDTAKADPRFFKPFPLLANERGREKGGKALDVRHPPHLPVLTLKLPQDKGLRQSDIMSFEPGR